MVTRTNIRLGLTGAVLLMIFGAFSGCSDLPTEPQLEAQTQVDMKVAADPEECVWISGMVHCAPSRR